MHWYHALFMGFLVTSLISSAGMTVGLLVQIINGTSGQSIENDASKNGTLAVYIVMLVFHVFLLGVSVFGLVLCVMTRKNLYQLDNVLRNKFTIWIVFWVTAFLGIFATGSCAIVRAKDSTGQLSDLFETFKNHLLDAKYTSLFLKYQSQHNCCGIYGSDDWVVAQLQNRDLEESPSTGNCHLSEETISNGCGTEIVSAVSVGLTLFGTLTLVQLVFGLAAGVFAGFSFCHWLNYDVIVIPEDEVGDVIVVEPPKGAGDKLQESTSTFNQELIVEHSSHHFPKSKRSMRRSKTVETVAFGSYITNPALRKTATRVLPGMKSISRNDEGFSSDPIHSRVEIPASPVQFDSHLRHPSKFSPAEYAPSAQERSKKNTLLEKEKKTVLKGALHGGKVIGEMHVDHKFDKDGKPIADPNDKKRATLMIVRNKLVTEQVHPPGHHGQTGHLAEDIAEMSGMNAKTKIEDMIIPELEEEHHKAREQEQEPEKNKKVFGSVTGDAAQLDVDNLINPAHLRAKEKAREKKYEEEINVIKPHYLSLQPAPEYHHYLGGPSIPVHPQEHQWHDHYIGPEHEYEHDHEHYIPEELHPTHGYHHPEDHHHPEHYLTDEQHHHPHPHHKHEPEHHLQHEHEHEHEHEHRH